MNTVGKLLNEMEHDRGAYDNYQLGIRMQISLIYLSNLLENFRGKSDFTTFISYLVMQIF